MITLLKSSIDCRFARWKIFDNNEREKEKRRKNKTERVKKKKIGPRAHWHLHKGLLFFRDSFFLALLLRHTLKYITVIGGDCEITFEILISRPREDRMTLFLCDAFFLLEKN